MPGIEESQDVVVTGIGVVTPAGCTPEKLVAALREGRSTAAPLMGPDGPDRRHFGCQVPDLAEIPPLTAPSGREIRRMDRFAHLGLVAARLAHADAGSPTPVPSRGAVVVGNAVGGRHTSDRESANFFARGPKGVNPLMPLVTMPNAAAALVSMSLGWRGPAHTVANTCASGADAIGYGVMLLRAGVVDVVVAGGCESTLSPVTLAGFANLGALSTRTEAPERASRPFDADRDGFVMGEGAGFVVLERLREARDRGARPLAVVAGYAATADAYHLSQPRDDGAGAVAAMSDAIAQAGLTPADIVHVNAHGTSTPHNDRIEAMAIRTVFGKSAPPVTSAKGSIGHLIGAAGAVEFVATVLAMRAGEVPPTANHDRLDPDLDIDVVHTTPRVVPIGPALTNSFGFGGHNACLVVTPA